MCVVKQELKEGKGKKMRSMLNQEKICLAPLSIVRLYLDREPNNVGLIFYVSKCFFLRLKVFFYVKITEFSGNGRDVFFWPLSLSTSELPIFQG